LAPEAARRSISAARETFDDDARLEDGSPRNRGGNDAFRNPHATLSARDCSGDHFYGRLPT
jgi:hypothetical protein